ncbi:MAG: ATP-binding cassette domain-containing protein [Lachnospiraceae bacterium]|nr:ATP-binding cassette domain-containing protein [Lachnospiraceae bacterium]
MKETVIDIENLSKKYRLGAIGSGTLTADLQSWWARKRGKEDPNLSLEKAETGMETKEFLALNGINLKVYKGDTLGIIGRNGAGKSTLLKILSRVTAPTEGCVRLNGRISSMLEVGTGFHGELTGRENIYLNGAILGMKKSEVDKKIGDIIAFSECAKFIDTPVKRYSSGMYVKLAFAVAAHLDSEILVMDEVLAVGDMKFQEKCLNKMGDAAGKEGRTVLYVSHNMNTIQQLCNRCVVLDQGRIIYDGGVEDAIKIYMGNQKESASFVDLRNMERAEEFKSLSAKLLSLEALDYEKSYFADSSRIRFRLRYEGYRDAQNLCLRVIVNYADGSPVTMVTSPKELQMKNGEQTEVVFALNLDKVVSGKYTLSLVLYEVNQYGTRYNCDGIKDVFCFEIRRKEDTSYNMEWSHRYWGHVALPPIEVLEK